MIFLCGPSFGFIANKTLFVKHHQLFFKHAEKVSIHPSIHRETVTYMRNKMERSEGSEDVSFDWIGWTPQVEWMFG